VNTMAPMITVVPDRKRFMRLSRRGCWNAALLVNVASTNR